MKKRTAHGRPFNTYIKVKLLHSADAADGGAAVGALALDDGLAVLGGALLGIRHRLLCLALHAISLNSH